MGDRVMVEVIGKEENLSILPAGIFGCKHKAVCLVKACSFNKSGSLLKEG